MLILSALPAFSTENVPGEVLAVFANGSVNDVTADSLSDGGEHYVWVSDVAEELGAEVLSIYKNVSISGNEIMVLLRAKSGDGEALLGALHERPDVTASSLNYVRRKVRKGGKL